MSKEVAVMNTADFGKAKINEYKKDLYIQLTPNDSGVMPYENIVIQYEDEQMKIPVDQFFGNPKEK